MDEDKLADLNDIQDFFNRVDSVRKSASPTKKFNVNHPIGVKNFIGWCNEPCGCKPKSSDTDPAYRLGKTICALEDLSDDKPKTAERILENLASPVIIDTKMPLRDRTMKLLGTEGAELLSRLECKPGKEAEELEKELPENVAFYFALKLRLKDCPDEGGYYHYQFDDSDNTIARVDPLKPFTDSAHDNLNQQWHVLISVLAYLDVAHALSSDQHEYHCLYQHIKKWDKGDLSALHLQFLCSASTRIKLQVVKPKTTYHTKAMNEWLEAALRRL